MSKIPVVKNIKTYAKGCSVVYVDITERWCACKWEMLSAVVINDESGEFKAGQALSNTDIENMTLTQLNSKGRPVCEKKMCGLTLPARYNNPAINLSVTTDGSRDTVTWQQGSSYGVQVSWMVSYNTPSSPTTVVELGNSVINFAKNSSAPGDLVVDAVVDRSNTESFNGCSSETHILLAAFDFDVVGASIEDVSQNGNLVVTGNPGGVAPSYTVSAQNTNVYEWLMDGDGKTNFAFNSNWPGGDYLTFSTTFLDSNAVEKIIACSGELCSATDANGKNYKEDELQ